MKSDAYRMKPACMHGLYGSFLIARRYVIRPLIPLNFDSRVCPVKLEIKIPLEVGGLVGWVRQCDRPWSHLETPCGAAAGENMTAAEDSKYGKKK